MAFQLIRSLTPDEMSIYLLRTKAFIIAPKISHPSYHLLFICFSFESVFRFFLADSIWLRSRSWLLSKLVWFANIWFIIALARFETERAFTRLCDVFGCNSLRRICMLIASHDSLRIWCDCEAAPTAKPRCTETPVSVQRGSRQKFQNRLKWKINVIKW